MQDHRNRRVLLFRRMVAAFKTACGTGENDFRHQLISVDRFTCQLDLKGSVDKRRMAQLGWALKALGELWARSSMRRGAKSKHLERLADLPDALAI
jgi:hypothetical protein